uniref:NADH-ubiquinone oxidoreductase chain 2 n=1 Tax=Gomphiocephalus hodgsoni TaxID=221270 RepID=Q85QR4_GOMHO|nr:NADH dehydrogenase subunit 2 [Gomphiocephalus hodgsoni]AAO43658.1 NADH dehydrogenase subunit 2 [Gomphiocephalus hodgsoni]
MLIKPQYLTFIPCLFFGTILACSSSSWFIAWIGLEINLMSFAPILINKLSSNSLESAIKYFLVQAMASTILIFMVLLISNLGIFSMINLMNSIILMMLSLKAGIAPLHFWFPQVIEMTQWFQTSLIFTWQKIAPFILISFTLSSSIWILVISSTIIGMMGGINQTSIKKLLTYSSIIHSAWMLTIIYLNEMTWLLYFMGYMILVLSITIPFSMLNIHSIKYINSLNLNPITKMLLFFNFLSLAGMPPFLGFFMKMMMVFAMTNLNISTFIMIMLISSSFISLYFYMRMMYSSFFIFQNSNFWKMNSPNFSYTSSMLLTLSFLSITIISLMVLLI